MIPLSTRMRPQTLEEFQGQEHFLYPGSLFYNSIKNKTFDSAIFFGPSGTGKTTLARIIAREMDGDFLEINASAAGTKELKELTERARDRFFGLEKKTTYVYVDEFHRWNKLQQDSLLKSLEEGVIKFIGSTTENPYFAVNNAVLSRVRNIYEFRRLDRQHLTSIIERAIHDREKGIGALGISWEEDAVELLAEFSGGDARVALDTVGFIADNVDEGQAVTKEIVSEAMQRKTVFYDKESDRYNLLSALQKSVRGSDPDAAVHYLARILEAGDLLSACRRLLVIAAEDVGLAYPQAIPIVKACVDSALQLGLPEARLPLADAAVLMATAPKSNSAHNAILAAEQDLRRGKTGPVPRQLQNKHFDGEDAAQKGQNYLYPHDYPGHWVKQQYLPDALAGVRYYEYGQNKNEQAAKAYWDKIKK